VDDVFAAAAELALLAAELEAAEKEPVAA